MIVHVYLILSPGGDRVYSQTKPPPKHFVDSLKKKDPDTKIYRADILIPGWRIEDEVLQAIATEEQ
jgi:hypothetical protein